MRIEMACPEKSLALAVEMLYQFHPYEEPVFDVYALTPRPRREAGAGEEPREGTRGDHHQTRQRLTLVVRVRKLHRARRPASAG